MNVSGISAFSERHFLRGGVYLVLLFFPLTAIQCKREVGRASLPFADQEMEESVNHWLLRDCGEQQEDRVLKVLLSDPERAGEIVLQAVLEGPSDSLALEFLTYVDMSYELVRAQYATGDSLLFPLEADRTAFGHQTREDFLERRYRHWVMSYRSRGLETLGLLGYEKSRDILEALSKDTSQPELQKSSAYGMRRLKER